MKGKLIQFLERNGRLFMFLTVAELLWAILIYAR